MNEVELSYIAGFFDGEGCVCISANCSVRVVVAQQRTDVLDWMLTEFRGTVQRCKSQNAAKWQIANKPDTLKFLKAIRPYLRVKQIEVDLAIKMLELSSTNSTRPQSKNGRFLPNPNKDAREQIFRMYRLYRDQTSKQSVALRKRNKEKKLM